MGEGDLHGHLRFIPSHSCGDITLSSSSIKGRYVASLNPSEGRWYQAFAMGCCARIDDIIRQDRAYSIEVLLKLVDMYEAEWTDLGFGMARNSIYTCTFLLLPCLGGTRGSRPSERMITPGCHGPLWGDSKPTGEWPAIT